MIKPLKQQFCSNKLATLDPSKGNLLSNSIGVNELTFYLYDHLGNNRLAFGISKNLIGYNYRINYAVHYFPYGKVMYSFSDGGRGNFSTYRFSKMGLGIGVGTFVIGTVYDGFGVINYNRGLDPKKSHVTHPYKAGLNFGVGLLSFINVPFGIAYGLIDNYYKGGIEQATIDYGDFYDHLQKQNAKIVPGFITTPFGALKQ